MAMGNASAAEINVTPLIDVLLVLLIIFMVSVPVLPRGLESRVAQGQAKAAAAQGPVMLDVVETAGAVSYRVDGHPAAASEVRQVLRGVLATRAEPTVFVRAERGLSFQPVAQAVAEAKEAGAESIALQGPQPHV